MSVISIWDILPILGIIALIAAFILKRRNMKKEERALRETLDSLQEGLRMQEEEETRKND